MLRQSHLKPPFRSTTSRRNRHYILDEAQVESGGHGGGIDVRSWHFGDIHAARFNVWFQALFGHQRVARLRRRLTLSGHSRPSPRPSGILANAEFGRILGGTVSHLTI